MRGGGAKGARGGRLGFRGGRPRGEVPRGLRAEAKQPAREGPRGSRARSGRERAAAGDEAGEARPAPERTRSESGREGAGGERGRGVVGARGAPSAEPPASPAAPADAMTRGAIAAAPAPRRRRRRRGRAGGGGSGWPRRRRRKIDDARAELLRSRAREPRVPRGQAASSSFAHPRTRRVSFIKTVVSFSSVLLGGDADTIERIARPASGGSRPRAPPRSSRRLCRG